MLLAKRIHYYECLPRWYRAAWYDPCRGEIVVFPFGVHIVAMAIYAVWCRTYWCNSSQREVELEAARKAGWDDGYKRGLSEGRPTMTLKEFVKKFGLRSENF